MLAPTHPPDHPAFRENGPTALRHKRSVSVDTTRGCFAVWPQGSTAIVDPFVSPQGSLIDLKFKPHTEARS
jgi:hypothetical protein